MNPPAAAPVELIEQQQAQIRRLVRRLVRRDDADDVEQEVYVAALQRPPRSLAALRSWIATTVRNVVAKNLRSAERRDARERIAAAPEPQPSSDALVARVELEEFLLRCVCELPEAERAVLLLRYFEDVPSPAIARRLGLGESTVRARLQRAIERLRAKLDERAGVRDRWVRALAPSLGAGPAIVTAGAGSFVAIAKVVSIAAACVAAGTLSFLAILKEKLPVVDEPIVIGGGIAPPASTAPANPPVVAARADSAPEPVTSMTRSDPLDPEASRLGPPGRLKLRVIEAASGEPLAAVTLRLLNETRAARVDQQPSECDVAASAGTWSLAILHEGFEPELRENIEVRSNETTDLGVVALGRGSGVIEGHVVCEGFDPGSPHFIELRGDGRSPCSPQCLLRSPSEAYIGCGYNWDRSVLPVGPDGRFVFRGLAAGTYFLRPLDERPRLEPTTQLELARGEWRTIDIPMRPPLTVIFHLDDERGDPFLGVWSDREPGMAQPIEFFLTVDGFVTNFSVRSEREDLEGRLGPPPPLDPNCSAASQEGGRSVPIETTRILHWTTRVDEERTADASLLPPPPPTPGYGHLELGCARLGPNRYLVQQLPACRIHWTAHCGPFVADELDVDLGDPRRPEIVLVFRRRAEGVGSANPR
jgi:RNA polymerase sigma factor (sigma-70 family)